MRFHKMLVLGSVATLLVGVIGCRFEKKEAMTPLENPKAEEMAPPTQAMPMPIPPEVTPPPAMPSAPAAPETMVIPTPPPTNPPGTTTGTTPEKESGY